MFTLDGLSFDRLREGKSQSRFVFYLVNSYFFGKLSYLIELSEVFSCGDRIVSVWKLSSEFVFLKIGSVEIIIDSVFYLS